MVNFIIKSDIRYSNTKIFLRHWSYRCVSNNYRPQAKASVANVATEISGNETGHKYKRESHCQNCGRTSVKSLKEIKIKTSSSNNFQRVTRITLMSTRATKRFLFLCVDVGLMQLLRLIVRTCVTVLWYFYCLAGAKKRARWLQARRIFSPSCPNLRIPNRFLREGCEIS